MAKLKMECAKALLVCTTCPRSRLDPPARLEEVGKRILTRLSSVLTQNPSRRGGRPYDRRQNATWSTRCQLSARDENDSLLEHEPKPVKLEQFRTEQDEAGATPEPAGDEWNVSADSEPNSFADFVKAKWERQEAGLLIIY
jgi:hypothetical protein